MSLRELLAGVDAVRFPVLIGFAVVVLLSGFAGVAHGPGGGARHYNDCLSHPPGRSLA